LQAHLDLAGNSPKYRRFDRVILDKKIQSRERYMKSFLVQTGGTIGASITQRTANCATLQKTNKAQICTESVASLQGLPSLLFQAKSNEEFVHLADEASHVTLSSNRVGKRPRERKRLQLGNRVRDLEKNL
jgi:RNA polymerase primary sigma factor